MSFTMPSVSFPDRWSFFSTMKTRKPAFILPRFVPVKLPIPLFYRAIGIDANITNFYLRAGRCADSPDCGDSLRGIAAGYSD
jgi:hypothetical protein